MSFISSQDIINEPNNKDKIHLYTIEAKIGDASNDLFKEDKDDDTSNNNSFDISRDFRPQLAKTFNFEKSYFK